MKGKLKIPCDVTRIIGWLFHVTIGSLLQAICLAIEGFLCVVKVKKELYFLENIFISYAKRRIL